MNFNDSFLFFCLGMAWVMVGTLDIKQRIDTLKLNTLKLKQRIDTQQERLKK